MTDDTDEVQQPDALLEQACDIVKKIGPGKLWERIELNMPFVPGYMCRYDDIRRDFAIAIVRDVLALTAAESWTATPPTEQGEYWHWNGDYTAAPFPVSVLWSGAARKCFVSMRDTPSEQAEWCDETGGYWLRIRQPSIAGAVALEQAQAQPCPPGASQVDPRSALPSLTLEQHLVDDSEGGHHD